MRRIILLFCVVLSPILSLPVTTTTKKPSEKPADLQVLTTDYIFIHNYLHCHFIVVTA